MKNSIRMRPTMSAGAALASVMLLSVPLADTANALDPRPQTYRARAKHDFRDVQLGLCHPANGSGNAKSTKCSEARRQLEVKQDGNAK
ncbi:MULTISPECIES: hypothetical protein [unclassified Xanthobacter]|uniref:hypothetical protein n=1 Tax=unclassified Xanthobacter TaxID=2623496 RepID=UPI001F361EEA|nr:MULTISPECIES: hypothetical protein [unclassified Xanthobacter]